jgi:hypothetical protein
LFRASRRTVHDAGGGADHVVFGAALDVGQLGALESCAAQLGQGQGDGAFQRCGGGQSGPDRHIGGDIKLEAGDRHTGLFQLPGHAGRVGGPAVGIFRGEGVQIELDRLRPPKDETSRTVRSSRAETATVVDLSMANGRTRLSL